MPPCQSGPPVENTYLLRKQFNCKRRQLVSQQWTQYLCLTLFLTTIAIMLVNQSFSPLVTYIFFSTVIIYVCFMNGQCCSHHLIVTRPSAMTSEESISFIVVQNQTHSNPEGIVHHTVKHTPFYPFSSFSQPPVHAL